MVFEDTEIRKLRPAQLVSLAKTLSPDSWKILLGVIPKSDVDSTPMFTSKHVGLVEYAAKRQNRREAEIFLDEWSTWGRIRPTIKSLIALAVKAELFRTADYLAVEILKQPPPERPNSGPAAAVQIPDNFIDNFIAQNTPENCNAEFCRKSTVEADQVINMSYPSGELPDFKQLNADLKSTGNDIGVIEMNYAESKMKICEHSENAEVSDLMKFTQSTDSNTPIQCKQNCIKSENLIQFSSNSAVNEVTYPLEASNLLLPNLDMLNLHSNNSFQPAELTSSELPLCIQNGINHMTSNTKDVRELKYNNSESDNVLNVKATENSVSSTDNGYLSKEFIATNAAISSDILKTLSCSNDNNDNDKLGNYSGVPCPAYINSQELPLTVLEFSKR